MPVTGLMTKVPVKQEELRHGLDSAVLAQALEWTQGSTGPWLHNWELSIKAEHHEAALRPSRMSTRSRSLKVPCREGAARSWAAA